MKSHRLYLQKKEKEEERRKEESVSRRAGRVCQARRYTALHNAAAIR